MGAIFGFTGPSDPRLEHAMAAQLAHRGAAPMRRSVHPGGTLCYLPHDQSHRHAWTGAGIVRDGACALALVGYLTGPRRVDLSPWKLLCRYRELGWPALERLRGAFVLALLERDTLHLLRDGAGVRTVYHAQHEGRHLFAVEPKAIVNVPGFSRRVRPSAVAQYLTFSFVPGEGTMLEGVFELPAGHRVSLEPKAEPRLSRYFRFECTEPCEPRSDAEWVRSLRTTHAQAVAERLPPDEPVGVFLSGGIDSSVVTAEVAAQSCRKVRSYAIHFGPEYPHELSYAREVARQAGTEHSEVLIQPRNFLPRLRRFLWHLDEPIGDPVALPNFELAAHVSRDVRWVFNGEGGDPCFGGPKNLSVLLSHWYGGIERGPGWRERAYLAAYRRGYEELPHLLSPELQESVTASRDLEGLLTPFFDAPHPSKLLDKLMAINLRLKGAHLILPKVERMTSAFGLTHAAPLFDERIVRLSFQLPPHLKLSQGVEKVALKRAYADHVPAAVIARPKSGMRVPVHYWFRKELRRYAESVLSPKAVKRAGIFQPERVQQLLRYDTCEGPGRYGIRLWMLLTFEIWRRLVVEREPL